MPHDPMDSSRVIQEYIKDGSSLTPAEFACLGRIWSDVQGGHVLDIGVGAGRTTPYLRALAGRYVGIDRAANMVASCRERFPDVEIRVGDARDLRDFPDSTFDLAFFSFNGIDHVRPSERHSVLMAIRRVLRAGGYFVFSAHNLNCERRASLGKFTFPRIAPTYHPLTLAKRTVRVLMSAVRGYLNYRRLAHSQEFGDEIAYINDGAHDSSVLLCYITMRAQVRALLAANFDEHICVLDRKGKPAGEETRDEWLHYIAKKPPQ